MNILKTLHAMGFKITWKLINIGMLGDDEIPALLNYEDVLEYLTDSLLHIDEQTDNIVDLICAGDDFAEFSNFLGKLANQEQSNGVVQKRKWRAYLLKALLENISDDCLQGLLELMEFWIAMGTPDDCPQIFPSNDNKTEAQEYFTQSSYDFIVGQNRNWLTKEIASIIKLEV